MSRRSRLTRRQILNEARWWAQFRGCSVEQALALEACDHLLGRPVNDLSAETIKWLQIYLPATSEERRALWDDEASYMQDLYSDGVDRETINADREMFLQEVSL